MHSLMKMGEDKDYQYVCQEDAALRAKVNDKTYNLKVCVKKAVESNNENGGNDNNQDGGVPGNP